MAAIDDLESSVSFVEGVLARVLRGCESMTRY